MITKIGLIAGEIWDYLEKNKTGVDLDSIVVKLGKERDLVLMSLGWLAREGHIVLEGDGPEYQVKLTNPGGQK
ncbi:MAG: winged helix-turn-helix domain-containing protein [Candidatus Tantalella remota]|nr:winged helix-turn-helix domain-containing protein [Candidatus Tantalella remota]